MTSPPLYYGKRNHMFEINENKNEYDVIVAGGGIAGAMSAIAAARNGAKVLIFDQYGYFGGNLTACGVGPMMTFFAGEKQVIKGLGEEMIQRMKDRGYSPGHVLDSTNFISYVTPFSAEGMKIVLDEMIVEAGCEVLFHTYMIGVDYKDDKITSLYLSNKSGVHKYEAKIFIDATGDADIATASNVPMQVGRESDNAMQPMTMNLKLYGVDADRLRKCVLEDPKKFPRLNRDIDVMKTSSRLSFVGFEKEFNEAKARGEISIPREDILFFETNTPGEFIMNTTRIIDHNGVDAFSISDAEIIGRKQCEELYNFVRKYIPGFENAQIAYSGPNIGMRSTRQIIGKYVLNAQDIISRKKFASTIAHSGYPIDIHNPKGEGTTAIHTSDKAFDEHDTSSFDRSIFDDYYSIPFEIMMTNEYKNLLVCGRSVSATFEAQAAIRLTPTLTAMGQACGTAAVMALETEDVNNIEMNKLQEVLIEQGSYIERI